MTVISDYNVKLKNLKNLYDLDVDYIASYLWLTPYVVESILNYKLEILTGFVSIDIDMIDRLENLEKLCKRKNQEKLDFYLKTGINTGSKILFNDYLKEFRKKHNLTQKDIAQYLNVSVRTIQAWEQGVNPCTKIVYLALKQYEYKVLGL